MDNKTLPASTSFCHDGDSFPSLPAADPKDWNTKGGVNGTAASYTAPAHDTNGFAEDSVTGDADCTF